MRRQLRLALPLLALLLGHAAGAREAAAQGGDIVYVEDAVYDELVAEAVAAYEVGDYENAWIFAENAIAREGSRPEGYNALGAIAIADGDASVAAETYLELAYLLGEWPANEGEVAFYYARAHDGLLEAGGLLLDEQRFEDAAATYGEMVEIFPESGDARFNHALALFELGWWEELRDVAADLYSIEPLNVDAHLFMDDALNGMLDEAASDEEAFALENRLLDLETMTAALPIRLEGMVLDRETGVLSGTVHGGSVAAGERHIVRIHFHGRDGVLAETDVRFTSPGPGSTAPFTAQLQSGLPITGWSYDLLR